MSQLSLVSAKQKTIVADITITGAAGSGGKIRITAAGHGLETGDIVYISGVTGTVEANGQWVTTKISSSVFELDNSNFLNAYVSGGTAVHVGFATAAADVDSGTFSTVPDYTLKTRLEQLSSGANIRLVWEDATETSFLTAKPVACDQSIGPIGVTTAGTFAGLAGENEKAFVRKKYDVPDTHMGGTNDRVRLKAFISGGAGKTAQFSAWIEY